KGPVAGNTSRLKSLLLPLFLNFMVYPVIVTFDIYLPPVYSFQLRPAVLAVISIEVIDGLAVRADLGLIFVFHHHFLHSRIGPGLLDMPAIKAVVHLTPQAKISMAVLPYVDVENPGRLSRDCLLHADVVVQDI
ncbi:hypothetical protein SE19_09145, partial [Acidiplasma aeolicum]